MRVWSVTSWISTGFGLEAQGKYLKIGSQSKLAENRKTQCLPQVFSSPGLVSTKTNFMAKKEKFILSWFYVQHGEFHFNVISFLLFYML